MFGSAPVREPDNRPSGRGSSVKDDWRARLSEEKSQTFLLYVHELESSYGMLSVSLDEALSLQRRGQIAKSSQAIQVTPQLCTRLTVALASLIRVLGEHAKHYGTVPNAAPLDPDNFQSARGQRSARISGLLSKVLLSQRTQFLHKLGTLQEMVEELGKEFCANSQELGEIVPSDSEALWKIVDATHYDLNTCLRETIVLLKCFLRALPDDQLSNFQQSVSHAWTAKVPKTGTSRIQPVRHRRMAHITGE
jgi:hypothetical protein